MELHDSPRGYATVRLNALLAAFVLLWTLITGTAIDMTHTTFVVTMLGFTWHAGVNVTWVPGK
ncbi:hypothetical protein [Streptomyces sp. NPDC058155]|uniref:hypothetical protein n=1 Tax=Streptomyces sp. NPDC058155 TaxID=3346359 RepID=UPI0036E2D30F